MNSVVVDYGASALEVNALDAVNNNTEGVVSKKVFPEKSDEVGLKLLNIFLNWR